MGTSCGYENTLVKETDKNKDPNGQGPEQLIEEKEGGMNMNRPEGCLNRERTKDVFRKITEPNFVLEAALARPLLPRISFMDKERAGDGK
ncbi:hypothetical protein Y1Q_0004018 [Alligator mississippiensis]|uniref:Uncharacterized protein n=1 Tax=Alligator mississippiensis TaxID=8496 RepID=A0A151PHU6_ALLMI|nr:hypothetical protein Y1Q_0004018 [Alligator mississippiensis]